MYLLCNLLKQGRYLQFANTVVILFAAASTCITRTILISLKITTPTKGKAELQLDGKFSCAAYILINTSSGLQ